MIKRVLAAAIVLASAIGSAAVVAPLFFAHHDKQRAPTPTRVRIPPSVWTLPSSPLPRTRPERLSAHPGSR